MQMQHIVVQSLFKRHMEVPVNVPPLYSVHVNVCFVEENLLLLKLTVAEQ